MKTSRQSEALDQSRPNREHPTFHADPRSERLEEPLARYPTNSIGTVEVLQELIRIAKEIRAARGRGEAAGFTPKELTFYDGIADNQSAIDVLGDDKLKIIAHELLRSLHAKPRIAGSDRGALGIFGEELGAVLCAFRCVPAERQG